MKECLFANHWRIRLQEVMKQHFNSGWKSSCGNMLGKSYRETLQFASKTLAVLLFRTESDVDEENNLEQKVEQICEAILISS